MSTITIISILLMIAVDFLSGFKAIYLKEHMKLYICYFINEFVAPILNVY